MYSSASSLAMASSNRSAARVGGSWADDEWKMTGEVSYFSRTATSAATTARQVCQSSSLVNFL